MAANLKICSIDDGLTAKLKKFRIRKDDTNAVVVMKIDVDTLTILQDTGIKEEDLQGISLDDLHKILPSHQPRYIAYSYCHKRSDGRIAYPLCFIFHSPSGCTPEIQMMYSGSKNSLINKIGFTKDFEVKQLDGLTDEWLIGKLME